MLAQRLAALLGLLAAGALVVAIAAGSGPSRAPAKAPVRADRARPAAARKPRLGPLARARLQAVSWARARNGMHEIGTTNCSPAIDRWERHMGLAVPSAPPCAPWCGAFVHEAYYQAGVNLSARLMDPNQAYWDSVGHHNGLRKIPKASVRAGDIVFFALHGVPDLATHEALVIGRPRDGKVPTAEGNVGHHAVVTRRGLAYVMAAARVTRKPARA
jgi:hypothetical protein